MYKKTFCILLLLFNSNFTLANNSSSVNDFIYNVYKLAENNELKYQLSKYKYIESINEDSIFPKYYLPSVYAAYNYGYSNAEFVDLQEDLFSPDFKKNKTTLLSKGWSLRLNQPIYNFESNTLIKKDEVKAISNYYDLVRSRNELMLKVFKLVFDLFELRSKIDLEERRLDFYQKVLVRFEDKLTSDLITRYEVTSHKTKISNLKSIIIILNQQLNDINQSIFYLTGVGLPEVPHLDDAAVLLAEKLFNLQSWTNIGLKNNVDLILSKLNVKMYKLDYQAAKSRYYPSVNLEGFINDLGVTGSKKSNYYTENQSIDNYGFNINIKIPIYDHTSISKNVKEKLFQRNSIIISNDYNFRDLKNKISTYYNRINLDVDLLANYKDVMQANEAQIQSQQVSLELGISNDYDILEANDKFINSRLLFVSKKYEYLYDYVYFKNLVGLLEPNILSKFDSYLR